MSTDTLLVLLLLLGLISVWRIAGVAGQGRRLTGSVVLMAVALGTSSASAQSLSPEELDGAYCFGVAVGRLQSTVHLGMAKCEGSAEREKCLADYKDQNGYRAFEEDQNRRKDYLSSRGLILDGKWQGDRGTVARTSFRRAIQEVSACMGVPTRADRRRGGTPPDKSCDRVKHCEANRP